MAKLRAHNLSISLDGMGSGVNRSLEEPFGHAKERLHEWFIPTQTFQSLVGNEMRVPLDEAAAEDDVFARRAFDGLGAEIMGAGKYGPPGWEEDPSWSGWWGEEPPFHSPVFVLSHRKRESQTVGETTFHFIDASPQEALEAAAAAAGGLDVRLGGGVLSVREFLRAGLVDYLHVALVPILLGRGDRLWEGLEGMERNYSIASTSTSSGVTHLEFTRIES
ncbi:deaminase [Arthrobacter sp. MYb211]|uniref:dihydrofolate reductase family protein n=1 Tax=unclassified Arthrobacter TaxID=235627 RepID=UPI000CFD7753|nr:MULTISPECIES: dihydrofolate reductase family protein [unclassified Arthrobacter]PRA12169.1 deaminase [Arthrobacter sp. MYb221]PRC08632.1 deaminase [Arthrobacter sp. MYb211]